MRPFRSHACAGPLVGVLAGLLAVCPTARAGSYVLPFQPDATLTDDSYLNEEKDTERNGGANELRLKATNNLKNRHIVVKVPTVGLAGRTVLQAWLRLTQASGSSVNSVESRVVPLLETFDESVVSWRDRTSGQGWGMPGGDAGRYWSGRATPSALTNGTHVAWQVGPIVQGALLGDFAFGGFLITADRGTPAREVTFRSSEYNVALERPELVIHVTDEPPAARSGWAEVQPRSLLNGDPSAPLTLWLDVDAAGNTPSGPATGIDQIEVGHGGALALAGIEAFVVGGTPVPLANVTWGETGDGFWLRFPRIMAQVRVEARLRVAVHAGLGGGTVELPVTVDDTQTPGAWAQALWPGEADGTDGNGDDWLVQAIQSSPIRVDVVPDTATVASGASRSFGLNGEDALGNVFPVPADSFRVTPPSAGTIDLGGLFRAASPGAAVVRGWYAGLRDSARVLVTPPQLAVLDSLVLRRRDGTPAASLIPGDTMLVDLRIGDGNGFTDVSRVEVRLDHAGTFTDALSPAGHAAFRWDGATGLWSLLAPTGSTWSVAPALTALDTVAGTPDTRRLRLGFVVGRWARASSAGEWTLGGRVVSETPPDSASATRAGIDASAWLTFAARDAAASFSAGVVGATGLPLSEPADAALPFDVASNAEIRLSASLGDLVGLTSPAETLLVRSPNHRVAWALDADAPVGWLDTATSELRVLPAPEQEGASTHALRLWVDLPGSATAQGYRGPLGLEAAAPGFSLVRAVPVIPTTATVVGGGLAATLALAEVTPHDVTAGAPAESLAVHLLPLIQGGDTGVDRVRVSVPAGFGPPVVTDVTVAGAPVAFIDRSAPGSAEVVLASRVVAPQPIRLTLAVDAPADLDSLGTSFVVQFDDTSTAVPAQTASEGDVNGLSDGNHWRVRVLPGALASLVVSPNSLVLFPDSTVVFAAEGFDVLGHRVSPAITWSVQGGMGVIGTGNGVFTSTSAGAGRVLARSDAVADTVPVVVRPARAVSVRRVTGPATAYQGQAGLRFAVTVENFSVAPVVLDTLRLRFTRGVPGDADADFTPEIVPSSPRVIAAGALDTLEFVLGATDAAPPGLVVAGALVSGIESGTGLRLRDADADTALAIAVVAGGLELAAEQGIGTVRPGQTGARIATLRVRNLYPETRRLIGVVLRNQTIGAGDQDQLDAALGELGVLLDDGDGVPDNGDATLLRTSALGGELHLVPLGVDIAAGATVTVFVTADLPLISRDGDVIDVGVVDAADVLAEPASAMRNAWPVSPPGSWVVDGMVAAQVARLPVAAGGLQPGAERAALGLRVPANGTVADVLERFAVTNLGDARPGQDLSAVRAWVDDGDGAFDPVADRLLGPLAFTGDRWELSGLAEPVSVSGRDLLVSVTAAPTAEEGRTVQLAVPAGAFPGLGLASGNSGPLDVPVEGGTVLSVSMLDRMMLTAQPIEPSTARPGSRALALLHIVGANSYLTERTLTTLVLTNLTAGPGTVAQRDAEARLLALRDDGDGDGMLDDTATDPVIATGAFAAGRAEFTGLDWTVPPLGSRHLFVTADVSPTAAADGDVLAAGINGPADVDFSEPTTANAVWPLDSRARWTVDGHVAAQVTGLPVPGATVAPGDGPLLALDVVVPANGYAPDVLRGVRVVNLGTAGPTALSAVELWRDGGDGAFGAGGDDLSLGTLSWTGASWQSPLLSFAVAPPGARLFLTVTVAAAAPESATVQLAIPPGGLEYESGNDGPLEALVDNPEALVVSTQPLLVGLQAPAASVVGQTIEVRLTVRNVSSEDVTGIVADPLGRSGTATLAPVSGPTPATFDLAPAEAETLRWQLRPDGVGDARFVGAAAGTGSPSGLGRASSAVSSGLHRVFASASRLDLTPVQTMPSRVSRGQAGVVPFSLTLSNPGGANGSDVLLRAMRVRLEDEAGSPVVPASLLGRVEVREGTLVYLSRGSLETSGSTMDLVFAQPVIVTGSEPATVNLRLDLAAGITVPGFRVRVDDSLSFAAEDATSGAPVSVVASGGYPVRSDLARVVAEASALDVRRLAADSARVGRASPGCALLSVRLENPGVTGITSDVRVSVLEAVIEDSARTAIARPADLLGRLKVTAGAQVLLDRAVSGAEGPTLRLTLSPPANVLAGSPLDLAIAGDLAAAAPLGGFRLRLLDSTHVEARDADTRAAVPARYDPDPLAGGWLLVEAAAETLRAGASPTMPASLAVGERDVRAMRARLVHPGPAGAARLRVDSLRIELRDQAQRRLSPAAYLDRLAVDWNGAPLAEVTGLAAGGSAIPVPLGGPLLEPGDTVVVEVRVDVDASAPTGFLELVLPAGGIAAADANTGAAAMIEALPGEELPLRSGLGRVQSPSRTLSVDFASRLPATLVADGRAIAAAAITLANADSGGTGAIGVDGLVVRTSDRDFGAVAAGAGFARIEAWRDGVLWARSAPLTPDSATAHLAGVTRISLVPRERATLELRVVPAGGTPAGVRLGVDAAGIGVVQPASALLAIAVVPEPGGAFPMWTEAAGFAAADLASSWSNYPNPFAAGREATRFVFYLASPARVTLRLHTPRGRRVAALLDGASRAAGLHQSDAWDGRNGRGDAVRNGVYLAELEVRYDTGAVETVRRTVAVLR